MVIANANVAHQLREGLTGQRADDAALTAKQHLMLFFAVLSSLKGCLFAGSASVHEDTGLDAHLSLDNGISPPFQEGFMRLVNVGDVIYDQLNTHLWNHSTYLEQHFLAAPSFTEIINENCSRKKWPTV